MQPLLYPTPIMLSSLFFYASLFISSTTKLAIAATDAATGKTIFLLAGQSNMAGRGGVINDKWDGYVPPQSSPNPSILRLTADLNWQPATEPLHRDIDYFRACGIGPGMAFANSLLRQDSNIGVIGLVPCAVGGTNITEWARGGHLYNQLLRRTKAALDGGGTVKGLLWYQGESDTVSREDADSYKRRSERFFDHVRSDLLLPTLPIIQAALDGGGTVKGLLWYQGESDTVSREDADSYKRRSERFFDHVRSDLLLPTLPIIQAALDGGGTVKGLLWYQGESDTVSREDADSYKRRSERFFDHVRSDLLLPTLPIIQVALASGAGSYVEKVREAQLGTWLVNLKTVDAKGLGLEPDGLHLTTASQVTLGEMLAQAFPQAHYSPVVTSKASRTPHNFITQFLNYIGF